MSNLVQCIPGRSGPGEKRMLLCMLTGTSMSPELKIYRTLHPPRQYACPAGLTWTAHMLSCAADILAAFGCAAQFAIATWTLAHGTPRIAVLRVFQRDSHAPLRSARAGFNGGVCPPLASLTLALAPSLLSSTEKLHVYCKCPVWNLDGG